MMSLQGIIPSQINQIEMKIFTYKIEFFILNLIEIKNLS